MKWSDDDIWEAAGREKMGDDVLVDLAFDMSEPRTEVATCESVSDFLGTAPDAPLVDDAEKILNDMVAKPPITYWDIPRGTCDHHRYIRECWVCNPCKICPNMKWNGLLRPYPRTKKHLLSNIHINSLNERTSMGKDAIGDRDYKPVVKVLDARDRSETGVLCTHNKRWKYCRHCNPCSICFDVVTGYAPADSWDHRKTGVHNFRVARMLGWM